MTVGLLEQTITIFLLLGAVSRSCKLLPNVTNIAAVCLDTSVHPALGSYLQQANFYSDIYHYIAFQLLQFSTLGVHTLLPCIHCT